MYRRKPIPGLVKRAQSPVAIPPENFVKLPNREMSIYIGKCTSIDSLRVLGVDVIAHTIMERHVFMTHKDIFRIVTGLARLDVVATPAISDAITLAVHEHIRQFGAHELAGMAVELTASNRRVGNAPILPLVTSLVSEFSRKIPAASPPDLAQVAVACADIGLVDSGLFGKMADAALLQIGLFRGPELCDLLLGYASLGIVHDPLLSKSLPVLESRISKVITPQLVDVGTICMRFRDVVDIEPLVNKWTHELEIRSSELADLDRMQMLNLARAISVLDVPHGSVLKTIWLLQSRHEWRIGLAEDDRERVLTKLGLDS